jgi:nucleotide-binding universal stress UspA family protein
MKIKRILWPTDLSPNAEKALKGVTSLSRAYNAEIHIFYVIEDLGIHDPWYGVFDNKHLKEIYEWEEKQAVQRLNQICEEYLNECPLYVRHVAIGDPSEQILEFITSQDIDMVVMATRGRKGSFSFGNVAEKVSKNAKVPVVLIPV